MFDLNILAIIAVATLEISTGGRPDLHPLVGVRLRNKRRISRRACNGSFLLLLSFILIGLPVALVVLLEGNITYRTSCQPPA